VWPTSATAYDGYVPSSVEYITSLVLNGGGAGEVSVTMTSAEGALIPVKLVDNQDGTYRAEFEATSVGQYNTAVTFAGQPTPASPYKISVQQPAVDTSKVRVTDLPDSLYHRLLLCTAWPVILSNDMRQQC